jgi:hypothetical protein
MEWLTDLALRRRRILQLGIAAAGGLMDLAPRTLAAESQTPLGTWPEGVHGDP